MDHDNYFVSSGSDVVEVHPCGGIVGHLPREGSLVPHFYYEKKYLTTTGHPYFLIGKRTLSGSRPDTIQLMEHRPGAGVVR